MATKKGKFDNIPKYPIGYDKDSVPNAIKRGQSNAKSNALERSIDVANRLAKKPKTIAWGSSEDHKKRLDKWYKSGGSKRH